MSKAARQARQEKRQEKKEARQEKRAERKEARVEKREAKQEAKQEKKEARQERRDEKKEKRQERRDIRREQRKERREEWRNTVGDVYNSVKDTAFQAADVANDIVKDTVLPFASDVIDRGLDTVDNTVQTGGGAINDLAPYIPAAIGAYTGNPVTYPQFNPGSDENPDYSPSAEGNKWIWWVLGGGGLLLVLLGLNKKRR